MVCEETLDVDDDVVVAAVAVFLQDGVDANGLEVAEIEMFGCAKVGTESPFGSVSEANAMSRWQ